MAFDAFLKIDGIPGESSDDKHKDWAEVIHYEMRISQPTSTAASTAGGATAERANFLDFSVKKALDKASPKLALACAEGTHIREIVLELCRAGGDKVKYMECKLTNCIVSSYLVTGTPEGPENLPLELVTFNYGRIEWTYTQQKRSDGGGGGQVAAGWDVQKNTKV